ncbi:cytosolic carboxypeptidase 2-like [Neolamprologus brichardi]|uniref:cytosolic carboxypeptidase 2-like n=1 Tax=Neolamprologus brichardi TaxID=32507 RepID=UPI0003EC0A01|nr:cytosolic carboxypeptidase 2-like [Neolamprologus brichardi]
MKQLCRDLSQKLRTTQLLVTISGGRPVISLRPPPELVNFSCGIRWPIECEVISDIIHHIEWDPPEPEPFYQCTGYERTPMPVGEERGKVVFCIDHAAKHPYFTYSRIGGSREPIKRAAFYDVGQSELTLKFESRFESGNLQKAVQVGAYDYELTLRTDMYTTKHTQWFYFRVRNTKAGVTYGFTIVNLMKRSSLYSQGMKPLLYSERDAEENGVGWKRAGSNIKYYQNCSQPFYQCTGYERTPMPVGEERGKVVFCIDHAAKHPYFTYSRIGGSREPIKRAAFYDVGQSELTLKFESRFESGNLQKAVQVGAYDYELTLRTDMYTTKHTQWFYFRVRNTKAGVTYGFTIVNLMKRSSLYSQGMKPLLYSERDAEENGVGWKRAGSNIKYYQNCSQNTKDNNSDGITLYSLSWTLQFPYDSDTCYLAHCYPYTYSRLQRYLSRITSNPTVRSYCKVRVLCQSLAGNAVYVITVTPQDSNRRDDKTKKAVVVTARVHPGESNASWMMEGFLNFLLGDSDDAQLLRDTFVFKVVPMLNPDGVVVGNYRCSLAGRDLNRNYRTLLRDSFPSVWHTRNMVEK